MLGKGKKGKTVSARVDTIVGQQTQVDGDLHFTGGLHIDGRVRGNVIAGEGSTSVLTVSEHGSIEGDVRVPNVILNGSVTGDVHYNLIEMAMGAEVNGSLLHQNDPGASVVSFERDQAGSANSSDSNT